MERTFGNLDADGGPHFVVATVSGVDEELGLVYQIATGITGIRLIRLPLGVKQVVRKLPSGVGIPEFLGVVKARPEFSDDFAGMVGDVRIADFYQRLCRVDQPLRQPDLAADLRFRLGNRLLRHAHRAECRRRRGAPPAGQEVTGHSATFPSLPAVSILR